MRKVLLFVGLLLPLSLFSQDISQKDYDDEEGIRFSVKGFLDTYHAVGVERKGKMMASRTRARGEFKAERGSTSMFVSLNAVQNSVVREYSGIELREAFLSYARGNYDISVGRQIIVWGVADALRLTDCVSPFDYSEFLARDYDDIRMPVNALRMKYVRGNRTLEVVCLPTSEFFVLPTDVDNPWAILPSANMGNISYDWESGKPATRIKNIEYGARYSGYMNALDFSLSVFRTWNKLPVFSFSRSDNAKAILAKARYERMTMLGADCSLSLGKCVVRGEAAAYLGYARTPNAEDDRDKQNVMNALLGIDWYPGGEWNISVQYCHKYESIDGNGGLATLRLSKKLLGSTLDLSSFAYVDVENGGVFNRLSAAYALNDQISVTAGYDFFYANGGMFDIYKDNSELWMKLKYSF